MGWGPDCRGLNKSTRSTDRHTTVWTPQVDSCQSTRATGSLVCSGVSMWVRIIFRMKDYSPAPLRNPTLNRTDSLCHRSVFLLLTWRLGLLWWSMQEGCFWPESITSRSKLPFISVSKDFSTTKRFLACVHSGEPRPGSAFSLQAVCCSPAVS